MIPPGPFFALEHREDGADVLHIFMGPDALARRNAWISERRAPGLLRPPGSRNYISTAEIEAHRGPIHCHRLRALGPSTTFDEVSA